jgi:hypothetical protein
MAFTVINVSKRGSPLAVSNTSFDKKVVKDSHQLFRDFSEKGNDTIAKMKETVATIIDSPDVTPSIIKLQWNNNGLEFMHDLKTLYFMPISLENHEHAGGRIYHVNLECECVMEVHLGRCSTFIDMFDMLSDLGAI